jgi:catechol 2,3-dioxygenase-like lactoylglutathione lyase family enzyme
MPELKKPRLVGLNHIALEVGNVEEALSFYGRIFSFELRGRGKGQAFIDMGDQFIALMETSSPHSDKHRHFGLVVDDRTFATLPALQVPRCLKGISSISSIPGATGSKLSNTAIFNSRRPLKCCRA